jgi:tRNA threonylcarbamoyladenosine biosynthesis protein TsaE
MAPERRFVSESQAATEALGEVIGARLEAGALLLLDGELGSGKTTFVRGLARGLGVRERVTSPTYALLQTYTGRLELSHLDAWMEGRERAFLIDGGAEALAQAGVAVIEWGGRVAQFLPEARLRLELEHAGPERRRVRAWVEGAGPPAERLAALLAHLELPPGVLERG